MINWLDKLKDCTRERNRRYPVYARIKDRLASSIESGELKTNDRLPADRELAVILGVDRSTVARAYDELEAEGLVESGVGRGTFVTSRSDTAAGKAMESPLPLQRTAVVGARSGILWQEKFSQLSNSVSAFIGKQPQPTTNGSLISFAQGVPSFEFVPQNDFEDILKELSASPSRAFAYTATEGDELLRYEIRQHLERSGMQVKDEELLVLSGSQQGIDLVTRTFVNPQDQICVEDPTYFWALCNFTAFGARPVPVPVTEEGLRLDILEGLLARRQVKLLYVMPSFQNPTGATMPASKRKALLSLAADYEVPVFEDNFVGDLNYESDEPKPLRSLPGGESLVIHQSTLSKSLCPGLRIGWMVAPQAVRNRLSMSKRVADLSTNSTAQAVVTEYLRRGLYPRHLELVRRAYRQRRDTMCEAMKNLLPSELKWSTPAGGMFIWVKLPDGSSARELLSYAEREGVTFSPGDLFFAAGGGQEFLRLSFIQNSPEVIGQGIEKLAKATRSYLSRKRNWSQDTEPGISSGVFV